MIDNARTDRERVRLRKIATKCFATESPDYPLKGENMSLWDALSGTIYHWTRLKEQSNRQLFHHLRGFDLRNIGLPKFSFRTFEGR